MSTVRLGFEVGAGEPVDVPIAHMVVTGQTQSSGKTTTLEALVSRARDMRALAFVTKRGEGAFTADARAIRPYFRERADWQFVQAVLEAETRERMKFERAWIMKATRAARTLRQVRKNIDRLSAKSKRAMDQDVFMMLAAYLDAVLPVIEAIDFAPAVELKPGCNVVDLTAVPVNVQGLVISSMLSWVHEHERDVTVILPESWKFIPQGRNSPVKMAAVALAREGAALRNFIWLDSQDLAGAEKEVVRQASVYLLGVQREVNEIKRALAHIPAGIKKPRAEDIATLERGQFFACWGTHAVRTYVQPAWMDEVQARGIARGEVERKLNLELGWSEPVRVERRGNVHPASPLEVRITNAPEEDDMTPAQERKLEALDGAMAQVSDRLTDVAEKLGELVSRMDDPARVVRVDDAPGAQGVTRGHPPLTRDQGPIGVPDEDAVIERVIKRLRERAPALLQVLVTKPEMRVVVERQTIEVDGKTLRGRLARMIADGKFDDGINGKEATRQLNAAGYAIAHPSVYAELDALAEMEFLTLEKAPDKTRLYRAAKDAKVNVIRK